MDVGERTDGPTYTRENRSVDKNNRKILEICADRSIDKNNRKILEICTDRSIDKNNRKILEICADRSVDKNNRKILEICADLKESLKRVKSIIKLRTISTDLLTEFNRYRLASADSIDIPHIREILETGSLRRNLYNIFLTEV